MFKLLRNKIQSLSETQQNIITAILILINIGIVIFWINFWVSLQKKGLIPSPLVEEESITEKQLRELKRLRQETGAQPFTEEQIQKQIEELEKLRSQ
jgi:nucleotide-binding universal stress UspA family protein